VLTEANPLGPRENVAVCRNCLYIEPDPSEVGHCPVCGEMDPTFRVVDLAQPLGFRTDFRPGDFEGTFEWASRSLSARVSPDPSSLVSTNLGNALISSGSGRIYVINDNGGADFRFARARPLNGFSWDGLVSVDLVDDPTRAGGLRLPEVEPDTEEAVALGASYVTDVLLVRAERTPEGVDVTPWSRVLAVRFARRSSLRMISRTAQDIAPTLAGVRSSSA
jgi:hypothetical protein